MKKVLTVSLAIILTMAFCFNLGLSIPKARAEDGGSSRDVTPPDVYITEDQLHARLFSYDGTFSNISGAFQNVSPEAQSIGWNGIKWLVSARGRFWEYNGTALTNVTAVETAGSYPYYEVAWNDSYWVAGSLQGSAVEYNGTTAVAYPLQPAGGADIMTVDWNATGGVWTIGAFGEGFYTHLISYPGGGGDTTDLGMPAGINGGFAGDYRANNDNSIYLAGGANVTRDGDGNIIDSHSRLYSYNGAFTDQIGLIPDLGTKVAAITGGTDFWLVGGEGTKPLYKVTEGDGEFTGTALDTPAELTSVKSIGWAADNNWLIGGYYTDVAGTSVKLYSYNGETFTDLTPTMRSSVQSYISDINSIFWNGSSWLIGGAGLYNVGPDNGGSVMSTDKSAKVAFTGGAVVHDSSVRVSNVSETTGIASANQETTSLKSVGQVYDFTCRDLITNNLVTQFDKSATINLSYDSTKLGDTPESSLSIYYYDEATGEWIPVSGGTIDTANKTITAEVNHFTKFGVFASTATELPYTGK